MELWDVYTINREKTNKTMVRGSEFEEGAYHIVVHACIFNSLGQMLIQQRVDDKEEWPGLWDITMGGSAITGETSQMAASRELKEELGIHVSLTNILPKLTVTFDHIFDDIFVINEDIDISKAVLQPEEVKAVKWATLDEIKAMINDLSFIPYRLPLIELLFNMKNGCGMHQK